MHWHDAKVSGVALLEDEEVLHLLAVFTNEELLRQLALAGIDRAQVQTLFKNAKIFEKAIVGLSEEVNGDVLLLAADVAILA